MRYFPASAAGSLKVAIQPIPIGYCTWQWMAV